VSSPDFNSALSTLKTSMVSIGQSYASDYTAMYKKAMDLVATITKFSDPTTPDDIGSTDWTDTVTEATEILDAAGQSPLMNAMYDQIEKEFGISIRTPLALAQNIMQGSDSNLLKVVVAMLSFEMKMKAFASAVQIIYDAMAEVNSYIADRSGMNGLFDSGAVIPNEIIVRLEKARNELQRTLGSPFDVKKYDLNTAEIKLVAKDLEELPLFLNASNAAGNLALKMMLEATQSTVSSAYRLLQKHGEECKKTVMIIISTDTTIKTVSSSRFVMAQKAVRRINGLLSEMKRGGDQQGMMIPKYIVALNVAYSILRTGKPMNSPDITFDLMDVSGMIVTSVEIDTILASCRKLLKATQNPRRLVTIKDELSGLYAKLQVFRSHTTSSQKAIEAIESDIRYNKAFEIAQSVLLLIQGLDMAQMLLENGDYSDFFNATEMTSTSEGAAFVGLSTLADMCDKVGLSVVAVKFREKAKEMQKQEREKRSKREARKERKKSKIATQIEEINKAIEGMQELVATASGTLDGIISVIN